jgi:hypothetical protein
MAAHYAASCEGASTAMLKTAKSWQAFTAATRDISVVMARLSPA